MRDDTRTSPKRNETKPNHFQRDAAREDSFRDLAEDMRNFFSEIDAFTSAAMDLFELVPWSVPHDQRRTLNRFSYLLERAAQLVAEASDESERRLRLVMQHRSGGRTKH